MLKLFKRSRDKQMKINIKKLDKAVNFNEKLIVKTNKMLNKIKNKNIDKVVKDREIKRLNILIKNMNKSRKSYTKLRNQLQKTFDLLGNEKLSPLRKNTLETKFNDLSKEVDNIKIPLTFWEEYTQAFKIYMARSALMTFVILYDLNPADRARLFAMFSIRAREFTSYLNCIRLLIKEGIYNHRDFKKWSLRNHPDKGGDLNRYQTINECNTRIYGGK